MTRDFWNDRYSGAELAYGEIANEFLVESAARFPPSGRALDIAAGEGRNALFLASRGLDVLAMDQSEVGMHKAQRLARDRGLTLRTQVADLRDFDAEPNAFDVVSSIYVHLPAQLRADVYRRVPEWLKPGGLFVLEAYAPDQIKRGTGGPKDPTLLAPLDTLIAELSGLTIEFRSARVRNVTEGQFHTGEAAVVQILARKH